MTTSWTAILASLDIRVSNGHHQLSCTNYTKIFYFINNFLITTKFTGGCHFPSHPVFKNHHVYKKAPLSNVSEQSLVKIINLVKGTDGVIHWLILYWLGGKQAKQIIWFLEVATRKTTPFFVWWNFRKQFSKWHRCMWYDVIWCFYCLKLVMMNILYVFLAIEAVSALFVKMLNYPQTSGMETL